MEDTADSCVTLLRQLARAEWGRDSGKIIQNFLFASLNLAWLQTAEGVSAATMLWRDALKLPMEARELVLHNEHLLSCSRAEHCIIS